MSIEVVLMTKRVTVIGSGGAGLVAAIAARKAGADVVVLSKTTRTTATCTAYAAGVFSLACCGLSPDEYFKKTMETGHYLNDSALVKILTEEAESTFQTLMRWGVRIKMKKGSASVRATAPNGLMGGAGFTGELAAIAESEGVRFLDWTVATSLRLERGRVAGVETENWRTGERACIPSGAVILATGGGGQIYSHTDNPGRITGDGYALASDIGAVFRDMEFVQFYPLGWAEPGFPKWMADVELVDFVRITDAEGREFLKEAMKEWGYKSGSEVSLYARDKCARLMAEKSAEGGVFAHLEDLTDEQLKDPKVQYCLTLNAEFFRSVKRPLRMAPLEHYFCGGVVMDGFGRTSVDGLYACGEVTGGVDGANRVGGNALTNIVVFGYRAGNIAAKECEKSLGPLDAGEWRGLHAISEKGERPGVLRKELQEKAWEALGPVRRGRQIEEFLGYLGDFENRTIGVETPLDRLFALEMKGLHATAKAVAEAALKREESLGTHWRID